MEASELLKKLQDVRKTIDDSGLEFNTRRRMSLRMNMVINELIARGDEESIKYLNKTDVKLLKSYENKKQSSKR